VWRIAFALLSCLILYCGATVARGQAVHPVTGRRIAPVMGVSGADWLDREEREREEQPAKAIAELGLSPGMIVGDVGAGTGFYSIRIARQVAPDGMVFANDIQPGMLARLRANAEVQNIHNIETVLEPNPIPVCPSAGWICS